MTRTARTNTGPVPEAPQTHHPHQSHFFFRSYEANLPTSLNDVLFLTRGFLPRRPAAVMGTAFRPVIYRRSASNQEAPPRRSFRIGKEKQLALHGPGMLSGWAQAPRPVDPDCRPLFPLVPPASRRKAFPQGTCLESSRILKSTELTRQENSCREHTGRSQLRRCHHNHILSHAKETATRRGLRPAAILKEAGNCWNINQRPFRWAGPALANEPAFTTSLHPSLRTESPTATCSCCGTLLHFSPVGLKSTQN